jgi:hypothetical protein
MLYDFFNRPIPDKIETKPPWGFICICIALSCWCAGIFLSPALHRAMESSKSVYGTEHISDATLSHWTPAFQNAAREWREALPKRDLPYMELKVVTTANECGISGESNPIACAWPAQKTVWVARDEPEWDKRTIMLHEIGHLLGLPHIEGDLVMNSTYQGKAEKPTDLDIVVAEYLFGSRH